jgi:hypothetical protein
MEYEEFIAALQDAGWRDTCDAQHDNIRALWERLFPLHAKLQKYDHLVENICEIAEDLTERGLYSCEKIVILISDSDV